MSNADRHTGPVPSRIESEDGGLDPAGSVPEAFVTESQTQPRQDELPALSHDSIGSRFTPGTLGFGLAELRL